MRRPETSRRTRIRPFPSANSRSRGPPEPRSQAERGMCAPATSACRDLVSESRRRTRPRAEPAPDLCTRALHPRATREPTDDTDASERRRRRTHRRRCARRDAAAHERAHPTTAASCARGP
jgi:hypothetical protein